MLSTRVPLLAWLVATACGLGDTTDPIDLPEGGIHVLFVGNSLTYTNDLPHTVAAIAASANDTISVAAEVGAGLALIDHLNGATRAAQTIARGGWDVVILQQGPTPSGICRDSLVLWTGLFDQRIRAVQAVTAVMMTWPAIGSRMSFDEVRESFETAAASVRGTFMPAGEAWRLALAQDPDLPLYGSDDFHPAPMGTFLAGLEIYERLTGKDARALPAAAFVGATPLTLPEATIRLLQGAAHEANQRYPAQPAAPPGAGAAKAKLATC